MRLKRLTLESIERLQELSQELETAGWIRRWPLLSEFISLLVYGRFPLRYLPRLQDIMENHGILNNGKKGAESLTALACFLGARLHKTPHEIKQSVSLDEVHPIYVELLKKDIEQKVSMLLAYHNPKELQKLIKRDQQKANHKPKKRKRRKSNVIQFPAENHIHKPVGFTKPNSAVM